ncbi:hypothetical protein F444_08069 [Phytophthora nicotianae P1976]|uniref:Uncharacterized protein n=1 Tax=Phytophthora nicotianae P1976 TaxID=1317066 RepID=A0A081ACD6_PHYNI|nr:hypothetical protein F444_08069 [Phytophthora nicotianae P1976]
MTQSPSSTPVVPAPVPTGTAPTSHDGMILEDTEQAHPCSNNGKRSFDRDLKTQTQSLHWDRLDLQIA